MAMHGRGLGFLFSASLVLAICRNVAGVSREDKKALVGFLGSVSRSNSYALNWKNTSVCSEWEGVTCDAAGSRVIALRLPGRGFNGTIPENSLGRLLGLQVLNLSSNRFSGPLPIDFSNLRNLTSLSLQFNSFSGSLPESLSFSHDLSFVDLSYNRFSGAIPLSFSSLTHLSSLNLSNNFLSGTIPDLNLPSLQELNLANNNLTGDIPHSLKRFPLSSFFGNHLHEHHRKESFLKKHPVVIGIVLGVLAVVLITASLVVNLRGYMRKKPEKSESKDSSARKDQDTQIKENPLVFFEGSTLAFNLEDLLMASAEVMGKGTVGISYKAALDEATTVAVKRLKEVVSSKREYTNLMESVGRIRHPNVTPVRGYYYSKEEKLVVYDYHPKGSVSAMLHVAREMSWETRVRIAVGAARGIAQIHSQNGGSLVHGNIKASNVFTNEDGYGCVSEAGLVALVQGGSRGGYRAPEESGTRKWTQVGDVYSFGVVVLELLTGKSPVHVAGGEEGMHLVRWVNAVVREEWTSEVFDVELLRCPGIEEQMVEMLQVAMSCVVRAPQKRPRMADVVKMVEGVLGADVAGSSSSNLGEFQVSQEIDSAEINSLGSPPTPR